MKLSSRSPEHPHPKAADVLMPPPSEVEAWFPLDQEQIQRWRNVKSRFDTLWNPDEVQVNDNMCVTFALSILEPERPEGQQWNTDYARKLIKYAIQAEAEFISFAERVDDNVRLLQYFSNALRCVEGVLLVSPADLKKIRFLDGQAVFEEYIDKALYQKEWRGFARIALVASRLFPDMVEKVREKITRAWPEIRASVIADPSSDTLGKVLLLVPDLRGDVLGSSDFFNLRHEFQQMGIEHTNGVEDLARHAWAKIVLADEAYFNVDKKVVTKKRAGKQTPGLPERLEVV